MSRNKPNPHRKNGMRLGLFLVYQLHEQYNQTSVKGFNRNNATMG